MTANIIIAIIICSISMYIFTNIYLANIKFPVTINGKTYELTDHQHDKYVEIKRTKKIYDAEMRDGNFTVFVEEEPNNIAYKIDRDGYVTKHTTHKRIVRKINGKVCWTTI